MLLGVDAVGPVRHGHDIADCPVVLIPDLTDQLLQDILVCDDSQRAAIVVGDDRQVDLFFRHDPEKVIDLGRLVDEIGLVEKRPDIKGMSPADVVADIAPDVQDADDVVDGSLIDGKAAVVLVLDEGQDLLLGHVDVDRRHVHAAGQDAFDRDVAELQGGRDQVSLRLVDLALFGHVLDDVIEVIFRDGGLVVPLCQLRHAIADPGQDGRRGTQEGHEHTKNPCCRETEGFTVFPGKTFGQHFSEEKYHQGRDQRRYGDRGDTPPLTHVDRDDRGRGQMYNIGADQERRDRPVKVFDYI